MAKSGSNNVRLNPGGGSLFESRVRWNIVSQSTSGNSSVVEVRTYLYAEYAISMGSRTGSTAISGAGTQTYSYNPGSMSGERLLSTKRFTVKHDSDGRASRTITVKNRIEITYAGYYAGTASHSFTISLDKINRVPNVPSVSISNITRDSARINWSTNLPVKSFSYRIKPSGGSWTAWRTSSVSNKTSGNVTATGLEDGKYYDVQAQVLGQYVSTWTSSRSSSFTTLHASYLSGLKLTPVSGYNNRLRVSYSTSKTGGTTYIEYNRGGTWTSIANGEDITGLADNTSYTYSFRARNSSGVSNSYSATGRTHAQPVGSFSVTQSNKTKLNLTTSGKGNYTSTQYRVNSGSWIDFTNSATITSGISPGKTYSVEVRMISSTTGITRSLGTKSVSTPALADMTLSVGSVSRNTASINVSATDNLHSIEFEVNGSGKWLSQNVSGRGTSISLSGLKSNTSYTVRVKGVDQSSGLAVTQKSITIKTSAFRPPRVELQSTLASIIATYTIVDSCKIQKQSSGAIPETGILPTGRTYTVQFKLDESGNLFYANTNYTVWTEFLDEYSPDGKNSRVAATIRTKPIETVAIPSSFDLKSVTNPDYYPKVDAVTTGSKYKKQIELTYLGSKKKMFSIEAGSTSTEIALNHSETSDIVRSTKTSKLSNLEFEISYYEPGVGWSRTKTNHSLVITFNDSLLPQPKNDEIEIDYSSYKEMELAALLDRGINQMSVDIAYPSEGVLGSKIENISVNYSNQIQRKINDSNKPVSFSYGPYESVSSNFLTVEYTDTRGLKSSNTFPVEIFNYRPPTIEVTGVSRIGGFSRDLEATGVLVSYDVPPVKKGIKNTVPNIETRFNVGNEEGEGRLYKRIPILNQTSVTNSKARYPAKGTAKLTLLEDERLGVFKESSSYGLRFIVKDYFVSHTSEYGVADGLKVPTGVPIVFLDTINQRFGVRTTAPRADFEVAGDIMAENSYALNNLFFFEGDVEDIPDTGEKNYMG